MFFLGARNRADQNASVICIWLAFLINTITCEHPARKNLCSIVHFGGLVITVFLASKRASETTHSGPDALTGERDIKEPHTKETSAA